MCLGAVLECNPNAIYEEKNPSPPICSESIYEILAWFPLAECMVGTLLVMQKIRPQCHTGKEEKRHAPSLHRLD